MTFVHNAWYMAAWSADVTDKPFPRMLVGEPFVLFRTGDGELGALRDVCPHRAVPLSLGTIVNDRIRCPYHALEFDMTGVCRLNPHVKGPPDRLRTRSYPVVELYGMIWIWPGEDNLADPTLIPDYSWFATPEKFTTATGYLHVEAGYKLVIDNLMDLAHAEYIHKDTVGSPGASEVEIAEVVKNDGAISVNSIWPDLPPNAVNRHFWTKSERVDQYLEMTWRSASNMFLNLGIMPPGRPREEGLHTPSAHILTPETETSTHYYWAFARDFDMENEAVTAAITHVVGTAFTTEDKPMLEAAQRMLDMTGAKLVNFSVGDAGSAQVRRELDRLAALEQKAAPVPEVAAPAA